MPVAGGTCGFWFRQPGLSFKLMVLRAAASHGSSTAAGAQAGVVRRMQLAWSRGSRNLPIKSYADPEILQDREINMIKEKIRVSVRLE